MIFLLFVSYRLIRFYFCSYFTNFNPGAELVIPIEIPTKEVKTETETHLLIVEFKIIKRSI